MLDEHTGVIVFLVGLEILYWIVSFLSKKFKALNCILRFLNFFKRNKSRYHKNTFIKKESTGFELINAESMLGSGLHEDMISNPSYSFLSWNIHHKNDPYFS
jgi:hypothetical protein